MPIWTGVAKTLIQLGIAQKLPAIQRLMGEGLPYLKYYNHRVLGSPNVELRQMQKLLEHVRSDVIDLSIGAPAIDSDLGRVRSEPTSGYPCVTGLPPLRQQLAEKLRVENAITVDPARQILVCNGVSQAIGLMMDTFVDRGDRVVLLEPTFFMYRLAAMHRGAHVRAVQTWLEEGRSRFEDRAIQRALRRAKILFLNSPANPTGGVLDPADLERLAWWCKRWDVLIFSDEVYETYLYAGNHVSIGRFPDARDRTITANSFSKSHGMASWRVGYAAGHPYLVQPLIVSYLASAPFVPEAAQRMALTALAQSSARMAARQADFADRRRLVADALADFGISKELPAGAFYFWIPVRRFGMDGDQFSQRLLAEESVLVMSGRACGRHGMDYVRISYAGDRNELIEGLRRLVTFTRRLPQEVLSAETGRRPANPPREARRASA